MARLLACSLLLVWASLQLATAARPSNVRQLLEHWDTLAGTRRDNWTHPAYLTGNSIFNDTEDLLPLLWAPGSARSSSRHRRLIGRGARRSVSCAANPCSCCWPTYRGSQRLCFWSTTGNQIINQCTKAPVHFSGINWFGLESAQKYPGGLWAYSYTDILRLIRSMGFTVIRLPFAGNVIRDAAPVQGINPVGDNRYLQGLTPLQVMTRIIVGAYQRGMRVILDYHRVRDQGQQEQLRGLWWEGANDKQWVKDWQLLAATYYHPTVVGVDLFNEPHLDDFANKWTPTWSTVPSRYNWLLAAERAGRAVQAINPNVIIFVEGIGAGNSWWGADLSGVMAGRRTPLLPRLLVPNKLVLSIHDYGPRVYTGQPWLQRPASPELMRAYFNRTWGYVHDQKIAPLWLGEFGSFFDPSFQLWDVEKVWLTELRAYVKERGISWTYWSFNPNSGDTGGIVADDYHTPLKPKLAYLECIMWGKGIRKACPAITT